ncbi:MAG TPA: adenylate/guanylate cyclase domain-containing protein, partial [Gemmatimonadaceae bacterium]|nr:adenylate/guanylate cyclase domain-containing protein [Gemmatimonadaceae bacterium]
MTTRHRGMLVAFLAIWVCCIALRVTGFDRPAFRAVFVETGHGDPVVAGFLSPESEARSTLHVGDQLIALGGRELHGQGQLAFETTEADVAWRVRGPFHFDVERHGRRVALVEPAPERRVAEFVKDLAISTAFALTAVLIILRARPTRGSRALFYGLAVYSLDFALLVLDGPRAIYSAALVLSTVVSVAMPPLLTMSFLGFPDEAGLLRGWNRVWPWVFAFVGGAIFASFHGFPVAAAVAKPVASIGIVAWIGALVAAMTLNYRRCGPVGRRQIKWILYSVYVGAVLAVFVFLVNGVVVADSPPWAHAVLTLSAFSLPIGVSIAALRFDLFDIDRLLGAMVAYNLAAVAVVGAAFLVVPLATASLTGLLGVDATVGRTGMAIALAIVAIFAERRLRPQIDRWFFRERLALEQALKHLPEQYAAVRQPDELWTVTGHALVSNLRPTRCAVFTTGGASFVPFFASENFRADEQPADSALVAWLDRLDAATRTDKRATRGAQPGVIRELETLGAAVVVPIRRAGRLEAFVCLGQKRSGDIYTETDLALLTALAKSLSMHMLRFDEAELLERARSMSAKMRRYVPGAVADAIVRGDNLEIGERDVSVLFVDIRGYTAMTDGRRAADVFSIINRYTETVSAIVKQCGGVVVEFNGDGMMAVFGA